MQNTDTNENKNYYALEKNKFFSFYMEKIKLLIKFKEDKCTHVYT